MRAAGFIGCWVFLRFLQCTTTLVTCRHADEDNRTFDSNTAVQVLYKRQWRAEDKVHKKMPRGVKRRRASRRRCGLGYLACRGKEKLRVSSMPASKDRIADWIASRSFDTEMATFLHLKGAAAVLGMGYAPWHVATWDMSSDQDMSRTGRRPGDMSWSAESI